jgi:hypothetical protein
LTARPSGERARVRGEGTKLPLIAYSQEETDNGVIRDL